MQCEKQSTPSTFHALEATQTSLSKVEFGIATPYVEMKNVFLATLQRRYFIKTNLEYIALKFTLGNLVRFKCSAVPCPFVERLSAIYFVFFENKLQFYGMFLCLVLRNVSGNFLLSIYSEIF